MAQDWIPRQAGYPKEEGLYLVTLENAIGRYVCMAHYSMNLYLVDKMEFYQKKGRPGFYKENTKRGWGLQEVIPIAYQKVPEPYKDK